MGRGRVGKKTLRKWKSMEILMRRREKKNGIVGLFKESNWMRRTKSMTYNRAQ